jgi:hypothetical protein
MGSGNSDTFATQQLSELLRRAPRPKCWESKTIMSRVKPHVETSCGNYMIP